MRLLVLCLALVALGPASAAQSTYFVAPNGNALGTGAIGSPFASIARALEFAAPGDTIYVRGGTYASPSPIRIDESGADGAYLHIWAYQDEEPVFDFTDANRGFDIRGDYLHLKGLVAENSGDNGIFVEGASYNILERLVARNNGDSGVQVQRGAAHNLLLNIDSYGNYDPGVNGENADGFAIKFGVGPGNVLRGCRAWGNSDDGYDFWSQDDPGQGGVTVENSWAFDNGKNVWDDPAFRGDSNGFKLGHGPGPHVLVRNLAWDHLAHGFDVNGNLSGVTLYHNTAYLHGGNNFNFDDDGNVDQGVSVLRNNASVGGNAKMDRAVVDEEANSWSGLVNRASAADFISLDDTGADGPRGPDGSLPELDFLRLAAGSDLIDAGVDVGLAFSGAAPDLGAFEFEGGGTSAEAGAEAGAVLALAGPNPFRSRTRLAVTLAASSVVRLTVHDALGREVSVLADGPLPAGRQTVALDAPGLAPGVYVVRLESSGGGAALTLTLTR